MPRYFREEKPVVRNGFQSFEELTHFVTKAKPKEWEQFQSVAHRYLTGDIVPNRRLKKTSLHKILTSNAHHLLPELHHELQKHYDQEDIGGGIIETLITMGTESAHLLGLDWLAKVLGIIPSHKVPQTLRSEMVAYLTSQTYKPLSERKDKTLGYTRLEKYDNARFAVYQNDKSEELIVCVRGSKLDMSDIVADVKILAGGEPESKELDSMLDQLEEDFPGVKYDISGHSLGTFYIYSEFEEHRDNMDDIYMFNPASSPLQNTDMLKEYANDPNTWYFYNQADIVSNAAYQQVNSQTFDTQVSLAPYTYSLISAHSLGQWYAGDIAVSDDLPPPGPDYEAQEATMDDVAEFQQDTPETQEAGLS